MIISLHRNHVVLKEIERIENEAVLFLTINLNWSGLDNLYNCH